MSVSILTFSTSVLAVVHWFSITGGVFYSIFISTIGLVVCMFLVVTLGFLR